ncbi:MAG: GMC family oxidoreductase [Actinomycetes bacterium]
MVGHEDAAYAVVVVGGGAAGAVVASRLTEDLDRTVCLVEDGPGPADDGCVRTAFRPLPGDWQDWVAAGARGWEHLAMSPYWVRLLPTIRPVAPGGRGPLAEAFVAAASDAWGVPEVEDFNIEPFAEGAGFAPVALRPDTDAAAPADPADAWTSVPGTYLDPFLSRPNLTVHTHTRAYRLLVTDGRVSAVCVRGQDGTEQVLHADEVVLCAGAVETPRLLMLSGLGPADALRALGLEVVADLPGVGANLLDHPVVPVALSTGKGQSTTTTGKTNGRTTDTPPGRASGEATGGEAMAFTRRDAAASVPGLRFRLSGELPTAQLQRLGHKVPAHAVGVQVGVAHPRSRGSVRLTSDDPSAAAEVDLGHLSDGDGLDAAALADGVRLAREVAVAGPLADWVDDEAAPGPGVAEADGLVEYVRGAVGTAHHTAGTAAIGPDDDPAAVLDPQLRVRGLANLRVADASVFPTLPSVDPMVAVLMVGERAADLLARGRPVM